MLRRWDGHVLTRALDLEVGGQRKKERQKRTWKKQVEEVSVKIGLKKEDALNRSKWSVGVDQFAAGLRSSGHPHLFGILPDFRYWCLLLLSNTLFLYFHVLH